MTEQEQIASLIKYVDEAKDCVPDDFKWSGRPLKDSIKDMADRIELLVTTLEEIRDTSEGKKWIRQIAEAALRGDDFRMGF